MNTTKDKTSSSVGKTSKKPAISVVIPVFNGENYLKKTLGYLTEQTFSDFELIFVDDGSTDRTSKILELFKSQTSIPMTIVSQKNKGPGAARNAGLAKANGQYLALLDADDHYEPEFLEKLYDKATSTGAEIVVCRADEYWPELDRTVETPWTINEHLLPKLGVFSSTDISENFFEVFVGWTWDKLFKADYIKKNKLKFQELRSTDDAFFCFMALIHAQKITFISDVLVHHTKYLPVEQGGSNTLSVSNSREASWDNFYKAFEAMKKRMKDWGIFERFERDYINYFLNFSLWHLITLTGSAYFQLFDKLKNSWFKKELGREHEADFYYSPFHYDLYTHVMEMSAEEFLFYLKQQAERKASDLEWHNHNLHRSLDIERQKMHRLEDENKANLSRVHDLEKEIADIKVSTAWKIGSATTAIPHQIKSLLKS